MKKRKSSFYVAVIAWLLFAICGASNAANPDAPDLPFDSGSTGADGPLVFAWGPSARAGYAIVYEPVRKEVIIFGGQDEYGRSLNDSWSWNGVSWKSFTPSTAPLGGTGNKAAYDEARKQVILFKPSSSATWVLENGEWVQKIIAATPQPFEGIVKKAALAYFPPTQSVILVQAVEFGALLGNRKELQTWSWDGANWQNLGAPIGPALKSEDFGNVMLTYHPETQRLVLLWTTYNVQFGGSSIYSQPHTCLWNGQAWTEANQVHVPPNPTKPKWEGGSMSLIYDSNRHEVVLFYADSPNEPWIWNGVDWTSRPGATTLVEQSFRAISNELAYDSERREVVVFGPIVERFSLFSGYYYDRTEDTWLWGGVEWRKDAPIAEFIFDMTGRPSGVWNFTTINIPSDITVKFVKNSANTPVRLLASGDVVINGVLDLSGASGAGDPRLNKVSSAGGPGGYAGGTGGKPSLVEQFRAGSPGQGPGGGARGIVGSAAGKNGAYAPAIGNIYIDPLIGGSGGGGGAATAVFGGGSGGGGGGAILLASSRDIVLSGKIIANGGDRGSTIASLGGSGSGGSIFLRADRIGGWGSLEAVGGVSGNVNGRIRLEAYINDFHGTSAPLPAIDILTATPAPAAIPTLVITTIAGATVGQPPTGSLQTPDVIFTEAAPTTVVVTAQNVPDGSPIKLRITSPGGVSEIGPLNLVNGRATFQNLTVPAGIGTVQASAEYSTTP
jgi:hypothetical protein